MELGDGAAAELPRVDAKAKARARVRARAQARARAEAGARALWGEGGWGEERRGGKGGGE